MLKQHLSPQRCPTLPSYALHHSFISDSSSPAPSGAGVCSQCMAVSLLLCTAPSSSHFCALAWTLHKLRGDISSSVELLLLWHLFSLSCFSFPFFPLLLSVWHCMKFLKYVFVEVSSAWLMGSLVSCCGFIGADGTWLCLALSNSCLLLQRPSTAPPGYHLAKSWKILQNFNHVGNPVTF